MRHSVKYTAFIAIPFFAACSEIEDPQYIDADNRIEITAGFSEVPTRTLLHPSDINTAGTSLTLYGITTKADGQSSAIFNGYVAKYPDASSSSDPTSGNGNNNGKVVRMVSWELWQKSSDPSVSDTKVDAPLWDNNLDYTFYSWLQEDKKNSKSLDAFFPGYVYDTDTKKLSITARQMPLDDSGFDFCYSDVVTRKAGGADFSPVNLKMNHLFASFSLTASNYTSGEIEITGVKLYGLKNKKSATIEFDANEDGTTNKVAKVTLGSSECTLASTGEPLLTSAPVTLTAGDTKPIIEDASGNPAYILMWPQTATDLAADLTADPKTGTYLEVSYKQNSTPKTVYLKIPGDDEGCWPAGMCQNLELSFAEKSLTLTAIPMPWRQTEPKYNYRGAVSVAPGGGIKFDSNSKHILESNSVYFKEAGHPIILTFKLSAPINASWLIEKKGDFDAFEIDNISDSGTGVVGDGVDTQEGVIDGNVIKIAIYPKVANPQKDFSVKLSFAVRLSNGEVTKINDLVYKDDSNNPITPYTFYIIK